MTFENTYRAQITIEKPCGNTAIIKGHLSTDNLEAFIETVKRLQVTFKLKSKGYHYVASRSDDRRSGSIMAPNGEYKFTISNL